MPNSRKLKTKFSELRAQRENDSSEVVEYIYSVGSLSKDLAE